MHIMAYGDILDFAIVKTTGKLVDIRRVDSGLRCGCVCPECGRFVVAKKGPRNRHHFAHLQRDQRENFCTGGPESGLHRAAKEIIAGWASILAPALHFSLCGTDRFGREVEAATTLPGEFFQIETSVLPDQVSWDGDWIPDVVLLGPKGELRVEVKVTHGISAEKQAKVDRDGISTLEYDLSRLRNDSGWNLNSLEGALRTDPTIVRWVFHPKLAELKQQTHAKLVKKVFESNDSIIKNAPVLGDGDLVFHPWFGLVPRDIDSRYEFISSQFKAPEEIELRGGVAARIQTHAVLDDSWMVALLDSKDRTPCTSFYDSLLSEHLPTAGCRSIYFGIANLRIVRGKGGLAAIRKFFASYALLPDVCGQ